MEYKRQYKSKFDKWWNEPNEEGVSTRDAVLVPTIMISMMLILINFSLWLMCPEQSWIGEMLFPFKQRLTK